MSEYKFVNYRLKGRVGEAEPGQGYDGKWFAQISVWDVSGTNEAGPPIMIGPWDTKEVAEENLKKAVEEASKAVLERQFGKGAGANGAYLDLKNGGIMRKFGDEN